MPPACSTPADGPVNGEVFRAFVEQVLCPHPKAGYIVLMDNLSSHQGAGLRAAIEKTGATLIDLRRTAPTPAPSNRRSARSNNGSAGWPLAPTTRSGR